MGALGVKAIGRPRHVQAGSTLDDQAQTPGLKSHMKPLIAFALALLQAAAVAQTATCAGSAPPDPACASPTVVYDTRIGQGADANGVPLLTKHPDARYVYWNPGHPSASDSNAGSDPAKPKQSLSAAWASLREGKGDWLLMAQGSTYAGGFGQLPNRSGLSAQYPTVVTTYDPANPTVLRKGTVTLGTNPSEDQLLNILGASGARMVFENIVFDKKTNSVAQVLMLGAMQRDIMFYNVRFLRTQVSMQGDHTDNPAQVKGVVFRRCVFAYGYSGAGHSQGLYLWNTDGAVIEDSVFYHNGWNGTDRNTATEKPDTFKHNAYFGTMTFNTVFRRNVSAAASSHGLQARGGGTIEDNVFANNPLNLLIGGGDEYTKYRPAGVPYSVKRNVIVGTDNIDANNPRGFGVDFINTSTGIASDNLIVNAGKLNPSTNLHAFTPHTQLDAPTAVNWVNNIVWNWGPNNMASFLKESNPHPTKLLLTMGGNVMPNEAPAGTNRKAPPAAFPDPTRTIATFAKANGHASEQAFWDHAIQHPEINWAKLIGDYIRAGFGR